MPAPHISAMLNQIPYEDAFAQIGQRGFYELERLYAWLSEADGRQITQFPSKDRTPWPDPKCRYASSMICRNEADLFGISMPRFAIRVYFPDGGGFVNVRRIGPFCQQAQDWFATEGKMRRAKANGYAWWYPRRSAARILLRNSCVGDALLTVPERISSEFHVLTANLAKPYGERIEAVENNAIVEDLAGSPYVKPIQTGGGLCAQSVCFMATSLLHADTRGVHGMAEVTLLASGDWRPSKMYLSGLEVVQVANYFSHSKVGLRASIQNSQVGVSREVAFRKAMRCYLLSGFPIILPVDFGRMQGHKSKSRGDRDGALAGDNICKQNDVPGAPRWICKEGQPYPHAILVVGCARSNSHNEFIIHDTARYPFMRATGEQLFEAGAYLADVEPEMSEITSGTFLPVVAGEIRMPLTNWISPVEDSASRESSDGVMQLAAVLQNPCARFYHDVSTDCSWRLARMAPDSISSLLRSDFAAADSVIEAICEYVRGEFVKHPQPPWVWLQWDRNSAWIWDAQTPGLVEHVTDANQSKKYLKCAAWKKRDSETPAVWRQETVSNVELPKEAQFATAGSNLREVIDDNGNKRIENETKPATASLTVSLLSSYSLLGVQDMLRSWPAEIWVQYPSPCEYYAMMQADAEHFLDHPRFAKRVWWEQLRPEYLYTTIQNRIYRPFRPIFRFSAPEKGEILNGLRGFQRSVRRMFARRKPLPQFALPVPFVNAMDRMADLCDDANAIDRSAELLNRSLKSKNIELVSLTSYLPGLADYQVARRRIPALKSSKFLLEFASRLKHTHPKLKTVTVAAGSLIYGITREGTLSGDSNYCAWVLDPKEAVGQLVKSLLELAPLAEEIGVRLAVEYEPSPLRVLSTPAMLNYFAELLAKNQNATGIRSIGLNLDIASWAFLDSLSPAALDVSLKELICHSHCSSTGRGSYGNAPVYIGDKKSMEQFGEIGRWIEFIQGAIGEGSGHISLELEACKHKEMILTSISNLRRIRGVR